MIYFEKKPENFSPKFEVSACFLENNGEILLLHRHNDKPQGGTWGIIAGKLDADENSLDTIIRESFEEIGVKLNKDNISYFSSACVRYDKYDFIYHMYHTVLGKRPEIILNPSEHTDYLWVSPEISLTMNLIQDQDKCTKIFYKI